MGEGLREMACFNDIILLLKYGQEIRVGLLAEYLPYGWPYFSFFRMYAT